MTIRSRLLLLLLPTIITLLILTGLLVYLSSHEAILGAIEHRLESLIVTCGSWVGINASSWFEQEASYLAVLIIIALAILSVTLILSNAFMIANNVSKPISQLKGAALTIAAGQYGERVTVNGPLEIIELANTFNTMSECLQEKVSHLQENSLLRERLFGEHECARLLQYHMLQNAVEKSAASLSDALCIVKAIHMHATQPHGVLLKIGNDEKKNFNISLSEVSEKGFLPMYQLVADHEKTVVSEGVSSLQLELKKQQKSEKCKLHYHVQGEASLPIVWSRSEKAIIKPQNAFYTLEEGDLFFLYNQGLTKVLVHPQRIQDWFTKVLRHFATDSLDTCATILNKNLMFLARQRHVDRDIHIVCFQVK